MSTESRKRYIRWIQGYWSHVIRLMYFFFFFAIFPIRGSKIMKKKENGIQKKEKLCQRGSCCWKHWKRYDYLKNRYHHAKMIEDTRINFATSPYCTLLFSIEENLKFSNVTLVAAHCNFLVGSIMVLRRYRSWNTATTTMDIRLL